MNYHDQDQGTKINVLNWWNQLPDRLQQWIHYLVKKTSDCLKWRQKVRKECINDNDNNEYLGNDIDYCQNGVNHRFDYNPNQLLPFFLFTRTK